jgi:hypothetical protein
VILDYPRTSHVITSILVGRQTDIGHRWNKRQHYHGGRDGSEIATSKIATSEIAAATRRWKRLEVDSPPKPSGECGPVHTSVSAWENDV